MTGPDRRERRTEDAVRCPVCGCALLYDADYGEWLCDNCEAVIDREDVTA